MSYCASLIIARVYLGVGLLSAGIAGKAICSWIAYRASAVHDAESTHRMQLAIRGTAPAQRAAVVRACAELEAASHNAQGRRPK
jgi:hypothetical protein